MKNQKGIGLLEVLIAALMLAVVVTGSIRLLGDFHQTMRDSNERTEALYKLSSVMEVHRHNPFLVDVYTPSLMVGTPSVESFYLVDATTEELDKRTQYTAAIEWLNMYDGTVDGGMQSFSLTGMYMDNPSRMRTPEGSILAEVLSEDIITETDTIEYANEDTTDDTTDDDTAYSTCQNGFDNEDDEPELPDCEDTNDWQFPT